MGRCPRGRYLNDVGQKGKDASSSAALSVWEGHVQLPSHPHQHEGRFDKGGRNGRSQDRCEHLKMRLCKAWSVCIF